MKIYTAIIIVVCALTLAGCSKSKPAQSPTEVLKVYVESYNRKDTAAMKQTFSEDTVKMYEDMARKQRTSIDGIIEGQFEAAPANLQTLDIEFGQEKIDGATATVEAKNNTLGESGPMPLVKEDGQWKIALDQFVKNILKKKSNE